MPKSKYPEHSILNEDAVKLSPELKVLCDKLKGGKMPPNQLPRKEHDK